MPQPQEEAAFGLRIASWVDTATTPTARRDLRGHLTGVLAVAEPLLHTGGGKDAYGLATTISGAWVQFARTGKPGHAKLPQWPAFTPENGATMILNSTSVVRQHHDADLLKVIEGS